MAIRYFCDRCHDQFADVAKLKALVLPASTEYETAQAIELCSACIQHLRREAAPQPLVAQG